MHNMRANLRYTRLNALSLSADLIYHEHVTATSELQIVNDHLEMHKCFGYISKLHLMVIRRPKLKWGPRSLSDELLNIWRFCFLGITWLDLHMWSFMRAVRQALSVENIFSVCNVASTILIFQLYWRYREVNNKNGQVIIVKKCLSIIMKKIFFYNFNLSAFVHMKLQR